MEKGYVYILTNESFRDSTILFRSQRYKLCSSPLCYLKEIESNGITPRNIDYSCKYLGCFEADCLSSYLYIKSPFSMSEDDDASSTRFFSISRVKSLKIV